MRITDAIWSGMDNEVKIDYLLGNTEENIIINVDNDYIYFYYGDDENEEEPETFNIELPPERILEIILRQLEFDVRRV
jgi:hypothetical protein